MVTGGGRLEAPAGCGPRHLCFHPTLPVAYIICELTGDVLVCAYDPEAGALSITAQVSSLHPDYTGTPSSAAIRMHPSGSVLYVSNRLHNSITSFVVDGGGALRDPDWVSCSGL